MLETVLDTVLDCEGINFLTGVSILCYFIIIKVIKTNKTHQISFYKKLNFWREKNGRPLIPVSGILIHLADLSTSTSTLFPSFL